MGKHRSGHSYQEFPILNVARRCGLVLNDRTLEWEEVEASCPFCGDHGPGKHHLFLNTTRNIFRCVLCGEKGNSVSLYAKMEGVSNRQAFRALSEDSVLYRFPQQPLSQKPAEREPSSLAVRHNVYYDMLMHLELSPKHKADLLARGLSEERIEQNMYRTLPMSSSARRFLAGILSDFHNLEGVPGFYVDRGYWNILGHSGLLVPCRDRNGYIQGLQIRLDDETKPDRKYRWLSSRGKAHGTRSYSYIHVTGNIHARTAYLTEGGLKGDVASFLEDYPCDPDGGELCIDLEIEDDLLPWNDHTFRIRFADGGCTLTDAPAEYHLKMGIGTLSTLLLGYKTAERLFELERIEGREDAVERLDDVLFHKIPYISDYI